jgi:hypothetical protein
MIRANLSGVFEQERRQFIGEIDHHVMPAGDCAGLPPVSLGSFVTGWKRRAIPETRRQDMSDIFDAS